MTNLPEDLQLYTEEEAAALLRLEVKTLRNQRWRGVGPTAVKAGHRVLYRLSELRAYLDRRIAGPQPRQPAP